MKNHTLKTLEIALLLGLALFLASGAAALQTGEALADRVVRLHVLANSDSQEDQEDQRKDRRPGRRSGGKGPKPVKGRSDAPRQRTEKRPERVEKLPARGGVDITAEKKAAADRAARQDGKNVPNFRRSYRRPRGKS